MQICKCLARRSEAKEGANACPRAVAEACPSGKAGYGAGVRSVAKEGGNAIMIGN